VAGADMDATLMGHATLLALPSWKARAGEKGRLTEPKLQLFKQGREEREKFKYPWLKCFFRLINCLMFLCVLYE
jgi:hypothetical protein